MEINVVLLNVLKYTDKKTNKEKVRIGYFINNKEAIQYRDNFKGISELSYFDDDVSLFNKVTDDMILNNVKLTLEEKTYTNNPFKKYLKLINIEKVK